MSQPIIVQMNVSASNQSVPMSVADNLEQMTLRIGAEIGYKGEKGDTGVGIASVRLNEDYTLTIALTDGTAYTTESIRGERGEQGEQGVPGEKGERGERGIQGEQGIQGEKGLQGEPGIPGEKGDKGDKGDKGEKGDKGDPGEPGAKGADGAPGAKGDKGDKGDKGETGASGADGKDGVNGKDGTDGQDGADGFSPIASVSKTGNTTTISITDKNGTTTAIVNDGVGDVASVNGKTGAVVLDAVDVGALPDTTVIPVQSVNGMTGDVVVPDPFMLLDFMQIINVSIPSCLNDIQNTSIPNVDVSITDEMGTNWAIASLAKYEVFDAETGGNRINVWPVCMFSMNSQKTLRLRMMGAGSNAKTAKRISGAVLLKHR